MKASILILTVLVAFTLAQGDSQQQQNGVNGNQAVGNQAAGNQPVVNLLNQQNQNNNAGNQGNQMNQQNQNNNGNPMGNGEGNFINNKFGNFFNRPGMKRHSILDNAFRHRRHFNPGDLDDVLDMYHIPKDVTPACGKTTQCVDGVQISTLYNRSRTVISYNYYEGQTCDGESILKINTTYLIRYRRENEEKRMEISLHMVLMYALPVNEKGVEKLKTMLDKYCSTVTLSAGQSVNIMDMCHRMSQREFNGHMRGNYYYDDSKSKLYIQTRTRRDSSSTIAPSAATENKYVEFEAFTCPNPVLRNKDRASLFGMGNLGDKLRGRTSAPDSASTEAPKSNN